MKKIIKILPILLFLSTNANSTNDEQLYKKIDLFGEVLEKIKKEYVEDVDQSDMIDSAINGAFSGR